jgi:hypothetical protein
MSIVIGMSAHDVEKSASWLAHYILPPHNLINKKGEYHGI